MTRIDSIGPMAVRRAQGDAAQTSAVINSFAWTWPGLGSLLSTLAPAATPAAPSGVGKAPVGAPRTRAEFADEGSHDFALALASFLKRFRKAPHLLVRVDRPRPGELVCRRTIVCCDGETYDIRGQGALARGDATSPPWPDREPRSFDDGAPADTAPAAAADAAGAVDHGIWQRCEPTAEALQACLLAAGSGVSLCVPVVDAVLRHLSSASLPQPLWRAADCDRIERAIGDFAREREPGTPWWKSVFMRDSRVLFAAALQEALGSEARIAFLYRPGTGPGAGAGAAVRGSFVHAVIEARGQVWDIGGSGALLRSETFFGHGDARARLQAFRPPTFNLLESEAAGAEGASAAHRRLRDIAADLRARLGAVGVPIRQLQAA